MKNYSLTILALILTYTSQAQSFWDDATISAQFAVAHHDKRLFGYSETSKQRYLDRTPETWGTWQYGILLEKSIFQWGTKFEGMIGLGYSFEHLTFMRRVNHCFFTGVFCNSILLRSDNYWLQQVSVPYNMAFDLFQSIQVNLDLRYSFTTSKALPESNIRNWRLDFYSLEINPGVRYNYGNFTIGLNYRLWQWKKIDRVLFSGRTITGSETSYPILSETYEDYNPVKLWFSVGYQLGNPDHSRK